MPTNRQMEIQAEYEAARIKFNLIREGILTEVDGSSISHGRKSRPLLFDTLGKKPARTPQFNIPATRRRRLMSSSGATSFHFAHKGIAKVLFEVRRDNVRNLPGAARGHSRYIERECAVADLESKDRSKDVNLLDSEDDKARCVTAAQDEYLARPSALAMQPDGQRALITNIDPDDDERAHFWSLVEAHERRPGPDMMTVHPCQNPEFWQKVAISPACPTELRTKLDGPTANDGKAFKIGNGKTVRAFLRKQEGWSEPRHGARTDEKSPPLATFADGRGGRVQYRIEFELPEELSPQQNFELLREFCGEMESRKIPFVAVMHAPDHHNHDANWHAHIAYYDRPCRKIERSDIEGLAEKGYDTAQLSPGMWDFAVTLPVPGRSNRNVSPLRQKKVAEVSRTQTWPKKLRVRLAEITNGHLDRAGIQRSVDAGTFADMGIVAVPQEHLGTRTNAAETQGQATKTGVANEEKQWQAVQAEAEALHLQLMYQAEGRIDGCAARMKNAPSKDSVSVETLRSELAQSALLRKQIFLLEQEIYRAASRAFMVRQRNEKLQRAYEAKEETANLRAHNQAEALVEEASAYLQRLDNYLSEEKALLLQWRAEADQCEANSRAIEQSLGKQSPPENLVAPRLQPENIKRFGEDAPKSHDRPVSRANFSSRIENANRKDRQRSAVEALPDQSPLAISEDKPLSGHNAPGFVKIDSVESPQRSTVKQAKTANRAASAAPPMRTRAPVPKRKVATSKATATAEQKRPTSFPLSYRIERFVWRMGEYRCELEMDDRNVVLPVTQNIERWGLTYDDVKSSSCQQPLRAQYIHFEKAWDLYESDARIHARTWALEEFDSDLLKEVNVSEKTKEVAERYAGTNKLLELIHRVDWQIRNDKRLPTRIEQLRKRGIDVDSRVPWTPPRMPAEPLQVRSLVLRGRPGLSIGGLEI
ncbi:MobA/MobL family protein [Novosphingopyxis iocasae]|uniref:MobA/MobL family protein n=1 Tax=Novosphingopyxis iocasae TaxID=2762729 RepID=UPI001651AB1D|nr:MobA/MobL family protein [Novosphingopyxis iocasae]